MTNESYPTRKAAVAAMKEQRINGWAVDNRDGTFGIHVIVAKPVPKKQAGDKRVTARTICAAVFDKMVNGEDGADPEDEDFRADFIAAAMRKGVSKITAATRYADLKAGRE
jgi:hypothetical protein